MRFLSFLLVLCQFVPLAGAQENTEKEAQALWSLATEQMTAGQHEASLQTLQALIRDFPTADIADDALFLAASIAEEKLGNPVRARELYQLLLQRFPNSRSSLAGKRRLQRLSAGLGIDNRGAIPLTRFTDIRNGSNTRPITESIAMAQALLEEFSDWENIHSVLLWLAETSWRRGNLPSAAMYYNRAITSGVTGTPEVRALLGAAEVAILQAEYSTAQTLLQRLQTHPHATNGDAQSISELREKLQLSRNRSRLVQASWGALALAMLCLLTLIRTKSASWGATLRRLTKPPIETLYMLPVVTLLIVMALTGHQEIGTAVVIIGSGGVATAWLCGTALLCVQPLSGRWALLCSSAATVATLSLCYLALYRGQLLDLIITTVRFGPQ